MMMKDIGLKQKDIIKIRTVFSRHKNIHKVILYGSRAMGHFRPASDIDLTLVGQHITLTQLNKIEMELDNLYLPYKMDISIYDMIENQEFLDHIERMGIEFYSAN